MSTPALEYLFDFVSPYSYLAWTRLRGLAARGELIVRARPVLFAALLDAHGRMGPAEIPARRRFLLRDCLRWAARAGVPFTLPARHPFRPLTALRLALSEVAGADQHAVVDAIWRAGWERGEDLGDPQVLSAALDAIGLNGAELLARTRDPQVKAALRQGTAAAVDAGVFGVPTFRVADELVWGNDRLDDALALLRGEGRLDPARVAALDATPSGARRAPPPPARSAPPAAPPPKTPEAAERVARIFRGAPFVEHLGIRLCAQGAGWVETEMLLRPEHLQQDGFAHAGVLGTIADHSAGGAAGTVMEPGRTPLSIEYKVNLLRPGQGERLRCRATVIRAGRRIVVSEAEVFALAENAADGAGRLVAKATVTLAVAEAEALQQRSP